MPLPALTVVKTRKTLTLFGWFAIFIPALLVFLFIISTIHPFLYLSKPIEGQALIVNGWLSDPDLTEAIEIYEKGNYKVLIVSGGPIYRGVLSRYKNYAELGYSSLKALGFKSENILSAPAGAVQKDRTYAGALAVKDKLKDIPYKITKVNVFTEGIHSRRSLYLYRLAFGKNYKVGIIPSTIRHYDPNRWWVYSAGVRQTINETIAYFYARFFFNP